MQTHAIYICNAWPPMRQSGMDKFKQHLQTLIDWANEHRKATAVIVAFIAGYVLGRLI